MSIRRLVLLPLLLAPPVLAQRPIPRGEAPTVGAYVPVGAIAGDAEATAIDLNPAALPFLTSWSLQFVHSELDGAGVRGGRGSGLYFASRLPYLPQLAAGIALQLLRPPELFPYRDSGKLSLSLAWRPLRGLSFGLTYAHLFTGNTIGVDGLDTLDVAAAARLGRYFALALVVHDLFSPKFQGLPLQRVYEPEIAVRPLGDDRLEIALAARLGERRGDIDPRLRLSSLVTPGLALRGALELKRDIDGDGRPENDLRATLGFELDLARVGAGAYALFGGRAGGSYFHGASITARVSGDRYPTLYSRRRFERIDLGPGDDRSRTALLAHLRQLERDRRLEGVVLVLGDVAGAWASMDELRDAVQRLRAAGKRVFAYGTEVKTKGYYVAAAAERVWLAPAGGVRLVGMSQTAMYFRGSFDLLSVQADFIKIAEYKTAPEQYTRVGPSPESKQMRSALLDDVWGRIVERIASARHLDAERVRALIDAGPYTAAEASRAGLVDALVNPDEVEERLSELVGHPVAIAPPETHPDRPRSWQPPEIAVLYVDGDIVDGKSRTIPILDLKTVGHQTLLEALAEARASPRVRAIVLRVDSPGGSALASDLMAREIARTRQVKPVVCSLGDVAASGGYFIAAGCDPIIAAPSTVTGSIGIFTGKFDISGLAGRLGVSSDTSRRGLHADIESLWRPYTEEERKLILEKLRYYYDRFVSTVAEGRKMKPAAVDAIARGRVWTGAQAREVKLVDRLGGFMDAVVEAKRQAGLGEWDVVALRAYPEQPSTLLGQLAQLLGIRIEADAGTLGLLAPFADILRALPGSLLLAPSTPQARLDYTFARE